MLEESMRRLRREEYGEKVSWMLIKKNITQSADEYKKKNDLEECSAERPKDRGNTDAERDNHTEPQEIEKEIEKYGFHSVFEYWLRARVKRSESLSGPAPVREGIPRSIQMRA